VIDQISHALWNVHERPALARIKRHFTELSAA
jgi:hypothetical protein